MVGINDHHFPLLKPCALRRAWGREAGEAPPSLSLTGPPSGVPLELAQCLTSLRRRHGGASVTSMGLPHLLELGVVAIDQWTHSSFFLLQKSSSVPWRWLWSQGGGIIGIFCCATNPQGFGFGFPRTLAWTCLPWCALRDADLYVAMPDIKSIRGNDWSHNHNELMSSSVMITQGKNKVSNSWGAYRNWIPPVGIHRRENIVINYEKFGGRRVMAKPQRNKRKFRTFFWKSKCQFFATIWPFNVNMQKELKSNAVFYFSWKIQ